MRVQNFLVATNPRHSKISIVSAPYAVQKLIQAVGISYWTLQTHLSGSDNLISISLFAVFTGHRGLSGRAPSNRECCSDKHLQSAMEGSGSLRRGGNGLESRCRPSSPHAKLGQAARSSSHRRSLTLAFPSLTVDFS